MKNVQLTRHGESAANAGEPTKDPASIPLTARGVEQAQKVANSFTNAPDLIIASPFLRAQATALATTARFPAVAFETWPIQEYTYLRPARCVDTTVENRRQWVDAYWHRSDPAFSDGEGAESFLDLVTRALQFLDLLAGQQADDIIVFSHGQFINTVAWLLEHEPHEIDRRAMRGWREYEIANHIENCQSVTISWSSTAWRLDRRLDIGVLQ